MKKLVIVVFMFCLLFAMAGQSMALEVLVTGNTEALYSWTDGSTQLGRPVESPRFTVYQTDCLSDNVTGLVWYKSNPYIDAQFNLDSITSALSSFNSVSHCGLNNFRIANINELISLFDYSSVDNQLFVDLNSQGFNITGYTIPSSTLYVCTQADVDNSTCDGFGDEKLWVIAGNRNVYTMLALNNWYPLLVSGESVADAGVSVPVYNNVILMPSFAAKKYSATTWYTTGSIRISTDMFQPQVDVKFYLSTNGTATGTLLRTLSIKNFTPGLTYLRYFQFPFTVWPNGKYIVVTVANHEDIAETSMADNIVSHVITVAQ